MSISNRKTQKKLPTASRLRELFLYDPHTGILLRRSTMNHEWSTTDQGYQQVNVDGKCLKAHRLIYCYMTGRWPTHEVDHKNLDKTDNRWENLRHATRVQNKRNSGLYRNSRTGLKGVQRISETRYRAALTINGKYKHLGYYDTPEEAHEAYCKHGKKHFGEFFRAA